MDESFTLQSLNIRDDNESPSDEDWRLGRTETKRNFNSLDECLTFLLTDYHPSEAVQKKKSKNPQLVPFSFARMRTRLVGGDPKPKTIRALFDSGASGYVISAHLVKKLRIRRILHTVWTTAAKKKKKKLKANVR